MSALAEAKAHLEMLLTHTDQRHLPRRLCTRVDRALGSEEEFQKYLDEDGTFDADVLILPRPAQISMIGVIDEIDRPLREGLGLPCFVRGVPMEVRACPYAGPRNGKPMNLSAFKIAGEVWREFLFMMDAM